MHDRKPPSSKPALDAIDYEPTDFWEARVAHDQLPPGVDEFGRMQPGYWEERRRRSMATDRALTGRSLEWLIRLPAVVRPEALRDQFPRIVNALSERWPDHDGVLQFFEHLLNDPRPGRKGFPAPVQRELELLCEYRAGLTPAEADGTAPMPDLAGRDTAPAPAGSFDDTPRSSDSAFADTAPSRNPSGAD
jgi:hypothetical protein